VGDPGHDAKTIDVRNDAGDRDQTAITAVEASRVGHHPADEQVRDWTHLQKVIGDRRGSVNGVICMFDTFSIYEDDVHGDVPFIRPCSLRFMPSGGASSHVLRSVRE